MTKASFTDKASYLIYLLVFILPFLIFYWMVPFITDLTIGNDYTRVPIQDQMELLFSIKTGSFPLYVPGYAEGQSSSALMTAGIYHPLPHIASMMPGYWDGKALHWNTFLRLLSLGLTHLCLLVFLRRLNITMPFAFLFSFITVYNLRMLDLFRYGSALEAYTGFLLLCTAIGWYVIHKRQISAVLTITGATYLLVTSGFPHMMYYALLGAGLFSLVIPFFISTILPETSADWRTVLRFWITVGLSLFLGVLLSSDFILPFYLEFMSDNTRRVGQDYAWAVSWIHDNFFGALSNFFYPMRSDVHEAFGGSSLFLMAAVLPVLKLFRVKIPRVIWVIWGLVLFIFLYMLGPLTPVHWIFWKYFPFASSFRIAGRITIIMPLFIMLLLSWAAKAVPSPVRIRGLSVVIAPSGLLAFTALLLLAVYFSVIYAGSIAAPSFSWLKPTIYTPNSISHRFNGMAVPAGVAIMIILSGVAALICIAFHSMWEGKAKTAAILLCALTVLQIGSILRYGTWIEKIHDKPTYEQMKREKKSTLDFRFRPCSGTTSYIVDKQLELSFMEPYLGKIYTQVVPVSGQDEAYAEMAIDRSPQQVFIEGYEPEGGSAPAAQSFSGRKSTVSLDYSSFNRLVFSVAAPSPAFFGLSYPYTGRWKAWVNGREVRVYRANGAANAIEIPEGASMVEFRYVSPATFRGMMISCSTFILVGLYGCLGSFAGFRRILMIVIVTAAGIGMFALWNSSLYRGENLGTEYSWTYVPPSPPNLAYSKKTLTNSDERINKGNLAVNGDRRPGSGFNFITENPYLIIDMHNARMINKIVLYEGREALSQHFNPRPLSIDTSQDGENWLAVASVTSKRNTQGPTSVVLDKNYIARYVRVMASGNCVLSFDEVEIYGPDDKSE